MADEKEIEESLRICQEIEDFQIKDDLNPEADSSLQIDFKNETFQEIDKILEDTDDTSRKTEQETEQKTEQETVPEPADNVSEKTLQLENLVDEMPEIEVGIGTSEEDSAGEEYRESHPFLRTVLSLLICIVLALILSLVITKYVAHHTSVEGSSMEPTLENGDQLIVENVSYYLHDPERFDVIVFPYSHNVSYIKRIIGLPGESIQIKDGAIYVNGEILTENYGKETIEDPGLAKEEIVLGEDEYFVLGDNRNASIDSRRLEVGTVKRSKIMGKAWLGIYPFNRIGIIK